MPSSSHRHEIVLHNPKNMPRALRISVVLWTEDALRIAGMDTGRPFAPAGGLRGEHLRQAAISETGIMLEAGRRRSGHSAGAPHERQMSDRRPDVCGERMA
jgi:hypothetical protein